MGNRILTSKDEFLDIVRNDDTINFTALAVTQWNALSIDALIYYLIDQGYKINASIVIAEHFKNGFLIDESFFTNACAHYYRLPYSSHKEREERKIFVSTVISKIKELFGYYRIVFSCHKVTPSHNVLFYSTFNFYTPDVEILKSIGKFNRPVVVCRTDEGVGTYLGTFFKMYPSIKEVRNIKELHGYIRTVFFGKIVYRWLHKTFSSLTFIDSINGLRVNSAIIPYYRKVFGIRGKHINLDIEKSEIESSIIICSSSMKRELVKDDEDLRVMKEVCDELYKRGYKLLLKPHPRDSFFPTQLETLHCTLLNVPGLSMEGLCEYANPIAVVSFTSTVLINPAIFWNIPTYCISDMLNWEKIDRMYQEEAIKFGRTFGKYVRIVKKTEDIIF